MTPTRALPRILAISLLAGCRVEAPVEPPVIAATEGPCRIEFDRKSITLDPGGSFTSSQADTSYVARDSRGRIYAASNPGGSILQWSASGQLERVIGHQGEGPGEFWVNSPVDFQIVPGDSIYANNGHGGFNVLDPDYNLVRTVGAGGTFLPKAGTAHFVGPDRILMTASIFRENAHRSQLKIFDRNGAILGGQFPTPETRPNLQRPSASAGDGTLWVAPPRGPLLGFHLEMWDTAGKVVRVLQKDFAWFLPHAPIVHQLSLGGRIFPIDFNYPTVTSVEADQYGLLWVVATLPKGPESQELLFKSILPNGTFDSVAQAKFRSQGIERKLVVLNPVTGNVIATRSFATTGDEFARQLSGSRWAYAFEEDSDGFNSIRLFEMKLVSVAGGGCEG